jgi:hypothetical protein
MSLDYTLVGQTLHTEKKWHSFKPGQPAGFVGFSKERAVLRNGTEVAL